MRRRRRHGQLSGSESLIIGAPSSTATVIVKSIVYTDAVAFGIRWRIGSATAGVAFSVRLISTAKPEFQPSPTSEFQSLASCESISCDSISCDSISLRESISVSESISKSAAANPKFEQPSHQFELR